MSIIHDALKKVQGEKRKDAPVRDVREQHAPFLGLSSALEAYQTRSARALTRTRQHVAGWEVRVFYIFLIIGVVVTLWGVQYAPLTSETEEEPFVCTGIVYDGVASICIINGTFVEVGDTINGATVIEIQSRKVILRHKGKNISLPLS